ncbi:MAG: universal stress protein [Phaeodactylibacter sp.]|nr:universal stress protein [Phaeodactylibacter sp.]
MKSNTPTEVTETIDPTFRIKQALIGLELTDSDHAILAYVARMLRYIPVDSINFLHVIPDFASYTPFPDQSPPPFIEEYSIGEDLMQQMEKKVGEFLGKATGTYFDYSVQEGNALEEVLSTAQDVHADLVIIGKKAGQHFHNIQARKLARKVHTNVLVVPENTRDQVRDFLVPIDFSPTSMKAFETALDLCKTIEGPTSINVLHIYEVPNLNVYKIGTSPEQFQKMMRENREEAMAAFLDAYATSVPRNTTINSTLLERQNFSIPRMINDYAEEYKADMILVGAHGHSRIELVFLGSITEHLLNINDTVPTLVIK